MNRASHIVRALCLTGLFSAAAFAHGGATGIVKERMDSMTEMGKILKSLTGYMRGQVPYDAAAVSTAALALQSHAGTALTDRFPHGSISSASEARDTIWSDPDGFSAIAMELEDLAAALALAAPAGIKHRVADDSATIPLPEMSPNVLFQKIGKTCQSCHADFRLKK